MLLGVVERNPERGARRHGLEPDQREPTPGEQALAAAVEVMGRHGQPERLLVGLRAAPKVAAQVVDTGELLVEIAARNHLMKLQGYDSAREFTRKIDEQIARQGGGTASALPPTNPSEMTSSELRSMHTRTRFDPHVLDRTRRQR